MIDQTIKAIVNSCYDVQKLRIQTGNRIVANFQSKLGIKPGKKPETKEVDRLLLIIRREYGQITEGMIKLTKNFKPGKIITEWTELLLIHQYETLFDSEKKLFKDLFKAIQGKPIWEGFLKDQKGVGPAMAGVIIATIDIYKATYASSIWKYAGLDVAWDGKGRSKRDEHLIKVEYTGKDGKLKKRSSITYNPFLKSKLVAVLAPCFLRAKGHYADIYNDYKNRLYNRSDIDKEKKGWKGHIHNMALRYMVKMFLIDLYNEWRAQEGLPVAKPYHEVKLGKVHRKAA